MRENNANRFLHRMANLLNLFIMVEFKSYYIHFSCYESLSKGYNVQVSLCFTVTSNSMSPNGRRQGLEGAAPFRAVINSVFGRLCRKTAPREGKTRGSGTEKRCSHVNGFIRFSLARTLARILFEPRLRPPPHPQETQKVL